MGRLAETEKYVAWVLENRDPRVVEFERVRRRTMAPQPPMTRAELMQAARGAKAWAADFVWRAETGLPLWLGGDPARLLEINFDEVDWVGVARGFEAVEAERDGRTELRESVTAGEKSR
jgi:hypothetical protein